MTLQEKIEAVDALRKIEILFKYYEDPIYLKALKYSRECLQKEIAYAKAVNDVFVFPKKYTIKRNKEELKEAFKSEDKFGKFITSLCNEAIYKKYGIKNYYSSEEWEGDHKDEK